MNLAPLKHPFAMRAAWPHGVQQSSIDHDTPRRGVLPWPDVFSYDDDDWIRMYHTIL